MKSILKKWNQLSLVKQIMIGLIIGIVFAVTIPEAAKSVTIFGSLFVGALKAIAPVLVLFLVMSAVAQHKSGHQTNMKSVIILYLFGTFAAGFFAVITSFIFPVTLTLVKGAEDLSPPGDVVEVQRVVDGPLRDLGLARHVRPSIAQRR